MHAEAPAGSQSLERFNFGDSGHVTSEQLRMLRSLDELLARSLTHALSAWLRTGVTVTAEAQTQQSFREFLEGTDGCYLLPVHLPDVHATGLMRWPLTLAAHMIELLLGGSGTGAAETRELTEIEDDIFQAVLDVALREWNTAWQQIALRLERGERSRNAGERQLLTPAEKVFCFNLSVGIGEIAGNISFCVAAPVLASAMRQIPLFQRSARNHSDADLLLLLETLNQARVRTGLCFPPVRLPASKLINLRSGSTLVLPLPSNATGEFRISEVPVASAAPARVGAWRAANVTALREGTTNRALLPSRNPFPVRGEEVELHA